MRKFGLVDCKTGRLMLPKEKWTEWNDKREPERRARTYDTKERSNGHIQASRHIYSI
jgi:hypothetical protein